MKNRQMRAAWLLLSALMLSGCGGGGGSGKADEGADSKRQVRELRTDQGTITVLLLDGAFGRAETSAPPQTPPSPFETPFGYFELEIQTQGRSAPIAVVLRLSEMATVLPTHYLMCGAAACAPFNAAAVDGRNALVHLVDGGSGDADGSVDGIIRHRGALAVARDADGDGRPDLADNCPSAANANQADRDGDGLGDACDSDVDGDGRLNGSDNCPLIANASQADRDLDGAGDACDGDSDGDGVDNGNDNCPLAANASQTDLDGDGAGDACDTDRDGDSIADADDNCPKLANGDQADSDGDGIGNACDTATGNGPDTDGDGRPDAQDNCPHAANPNQEDADADGTGDACDSDSDGDGVAQGDNCPVHPNANQLDSDGDTLGNACDADDDNDGVSDLSDNCDLTPNPDQADGDGDGEGDACDADMDGDARANGEDNCPLISNPDQANADADAFGDVCDDDRDGDQVPNVSDNCPLVPNPGQEDSDGIGPGDACDADTPLRVHTSQQLSPGLQLCRTCHIPGGVADTDQGRRFMLSTAPAEDYERLRSSWEALGRGVDRSPMLQNPSSASAAPHSGGKPWAPDSAIYLGMRELLQCWDDPSRCTLTPRDPDTSQKPLLGSARGGHLWFDHCKSKDWKPDEPLPADPRARIVPGFNQGKNVYFNAFWRDCHVDKNADGKPDYLKAGFERPQPKTCGELKTSIDRGAILMGAAPVNTADSRVSDVRHGSTFAGQAHNSAGAIPASSYNELWRAWGMSARPQNFDQLVVERYGFGPLSPSNPYPKPGETASGTNGGTGQLPVGLIQLRDGTANGNYSGNIGINCQACHGVAVDGTFHYGSGGAMLDLSTFGRDLEVLRVPLGAGLDRVGVAGRVRGTNNAQFSNVTAGVGVFDTSGYQAGFFSMVFLAGDSERRQNLIDVLTNGSTATGDTPAWWNVGRRTVKFVDGMFPSDAVRVDMALFFPLFEFGFNPTGSPFAAAETFVGKYAQNADHWLMTLKSPEYPGPKDLPLAEQGAILFHAKDLWEKRSDKTTKKGNGSCASCHGAYSPRYVNDPAYLEDPVTEGIAAYVVPIDVIGTDRVRLDTYNDGTNRANSNEYIGYVDTANAPTEYNCTVQNLTGRQKDAEGTERPKGYAAPPLYGVWATAPYFHNGSVPDVWGALKSSDRPEIWRRKSRPNDSGTDAVMGFDSSFARAYDPQRLGWKYDTLSCDVTNNIPGLECSPVAGVPTAQPVLSELYGNVLLTWNITNPPVLTNADVERRKIYNTNLHSQGNGGHDFGDQLTDQERRAIIEYLKTL